jgi:hypothetical protein
MQKQLIYFNEEGFNLALNKHQEKQNAFLRIGIIADKLGFFIDPDETDYKEAILNAIAEKYKKENTLKLSAEKLAMLKDIDLTEFNKTVDDYNKLKHIVEPDKQSYSTYATTPEQIERWNRANELKKAFEKAQEVAPFIKPQAFIGHLYPMFTLSNGSLQIYPYFVLNNL